MAEQFRKIYIPVNEFIDSWEKEVYELTNTDYFIFLLINELAGAIEAGFFPKRSNLEYLRMETEEISSLAFNIGDALQDFLEKHCFGSCSVACPMRLSQRLTAADLSERQNTLGVANNPDINGNTKEQCLFYDVKTFVVLDVLLDYYNFDRNIAVSEDDPGLHLFVEFITRQILDTFKKQEARLLSQPDENATSLFDLLIQNTESGWDAHFEETDDADIWEGEEWKYAANGTAAIMEQFKKEYSFGRNKTIALRLLDRFSEFLIEFLGLERIEDVNGAVIQEFITVVVVHELVGEADETLSEAAQIFRDWVRYVDFNHNQDLARSYSVFMNRDFPDILRTYRMVNRYLEQHPLVDYLLSDRAKQTSLLDGFFVVLDVENGIGELEDLHIQSRFAPVDLSAAELEDLRKGDILHLQLSTDNGQSWTLNHLEMIYPPKARAYLY